MPQRMFFDTNVFTSSQHDTEVIYAPIESDVNEFVNLTPDREESYDANLDNGTAHYDPERPQERCDGETGETDNDNISLHLTPGSHC